MGRSHLNHAEVFVTAIDPLGLAPLKSSRIAGFGNQRIPVFVLGNRQFGYLSQSVFICLHDAQWKFRLFVVAIVRQAQLHLAARGRSIGIKGGKKERVWESSTASWVGVQINMNRILCDAHVEPALLGAPRRQVSDIRR